MALWIKVRPALRFRISTYFIAVVPRCSGLLNHKKLSLEVINIQWKYLNSTKWMGQLFCSSAARNVLISETRC